MKIINYTILTPAIINYTDNNEEEKMITVYLNFLNKEIIFSEEIENQHILKEEIIKLIFNKIPNELPKISLNDIKNYKK